jgi:hypothetical protein
MALEHELEALAARADAEGHRRWMRKLRLLTRRNAILAYRRLLLDEHGQVMPDAAQVIADLAAVARLGMADPLAITDGELRQRAGRREIVLHLIARMDLDGSRLRQLSKQLRGIDQ